LENQKTKLSKEEILFRIKADKKFLNENFGVIKIGLFGSYAKDRQTPDSDIDLLVEFIEPRFDWLASLQIHLEKSFNKKIEIIRKRNRAKSHFLKRIEKEIIYA
jgi:predicted nucleotidyltransferase